MTPKARAVLEHAVDLGVHYGVRRAYKHTDGTPPNEQQIEQIIDAVIGAIDEWFDLPAQ